MSLHKNGLYGILCMFLCQITQAAPSASVLEFWKPHAESSTLTVDHSKWQSILDRYLITGEVDKINRFAYARVSSGDKQLLSEYLAQMQALDPRILNRAVQKSYWVNLYNALTVKLIIDNYPTSSITKLGTGFFSFGPWDDELATIQGQHLSLNDIEHRILRPIWNDNRIHYAVNCASFSCPNLSYKAYSAINMESILVQAAQNYVSHPRAVKLTANTLIVSSIYDWYIDDFGGDEKSLLAHLVEYADGDLKQTLKEFQGNIKYYYDWALNEPK